MRRDLLPTYLEGASSILETVTECPQRPVIELLFLCLCARRGLDRGELQAALESRSGQVRRAVLDVAQALRERHPRQLGDLAAHGVKLPAKLPGQAVGEMFRALALAAEGLDERLDPLGCALAAFEGTTDGDSWALSSAPALPCDARVLDSGCATGSRLLWALEQCRAQHGRRSKPSLYGVETDPFLWRLARMNMVLARADERAHILHRPELDAGAVELDGWPERFDLALAPERAILAA